MLTLTRRTHESVVIDGGKVIVTVVEIIGDRVKLAFTAAKEIPIHRAELQREIDSGVRVTPEQRAAKKAAAFCNYKGS